MKTFLITTPGLYKNWIHKLLNPASTVTELINELDDSNFGWDNKFTLLTERPTFFEDNQDVFIVNSVVNPENFHWYMHNFYGIVDARTLVLDRLVEDFFNNEHDSPTLYGTIASQYNLTIEASTKEDITNAIVEAVYLTLTQPHAFRNILAMRCPNENSINIEYSDFSSLTKLRSVLKGIPNIDLTSLSDMYARLKKSHDIFLNSKKHLIAKLASTTNIEQFNVVQQAIIGYAIHGITGRKLDWYNVVMRHELFAEFNSGVAEYLT